MGISVMAGRDTKLRFVIAHGRIHAPQPPFNRLQREQQWAELRRIFIKRLAVASGHALRGAPLDCTNTGEAQRSIHSTLQFVAMLAAKLSAVAFQAGSNAEPSGAPAECARLRRKRWKVRRFTAAYVLRNSGRCLRLLNTPDSRDAPCIWRLARSASRSQRQQYTSRVICCPVPIELSRLQCLLGHSNRLDVGARRAVRTGIADITMANQLNQAEI
jgi:hypothetical protein